MGQDLKNFVISGFRVLVCAGGAERAKSVMESLAEQEVGSEYSADGEGSASVQVTPLGIETGFIYPAEKARRHRRLGVCGQTARIGHYCAENAVYRTESG